MVEPADHLRARRAARRTALRRRRLAAAGAALVGLVAAVLLASGGPGAAKPTARRPAAHATVTLPTVIGRPADQQAALARLAAIGLPVYCGSPAKPLVALTFDDGPGPYTKLAIKKLRARHIKATFFLVGKSINSYPSLAPLERQVGAVGDHTMTHPFLPGLGRSAIDQEMADARTLIERNSGQRVAVFRPPYGARTSAIDAEAKALGLVDVIWTVDSADSLGADYAGIARNAIAGLRPGSIILMHENRGQTIRALATILPALARSHLHAVTLPELLSTDPPTLAQLRAGGKGCG